MQGHLLERITINPDVCHGKPTIRNTRYMVESLLEYLAGGDTVATLLEEFPDLEREDILACIQFAVITMQTKSTNLVAA